MREPVAVSPAPGGTPGRGRGCAVSVAALTGLPGAPVLTTRSVASGLECDAVLDAEQPGGARPLEPGAFGLSSNPVYRDGQLWFAHAVAHEFGGGLADAIHWGQVDVRDWPQRATMVQESLLGTAAAWSFCPALMVSAAGQLIVAYARSSLTEFPSVYLAGRGRDDPRGTMRVPTLVKAGLAAENLSPNRRNRYGDYFAAALDPLDGSVWILGEYGQTGNQSGMWLAHIV